MRLTSENLKSLSNNYIFPFNLLIDYNENESRCIDIKEKFLKGSHDLSQIIKKTGIVDDTVNLPMQSIFNKLVK